MTYQFKNAKILIVDDMLPMQTLLRSLLGLFGFDQIEVAENGQEGFTKFCRFNPDIVLTDWMMEPVNGIEMVEKIRKDPRSPNRFAPVLLMTGFSSRLRVEHARDMGITEFVVKPFTAKDLYTRIEHVIERPRQFVDAKHFFGPDRRRRKDSDYDGPTRRETDFQKGQNRLSPQQTQEQTALLDSIRKNIKEGL
ncbi:MAG: response regulator [Rhodospirillales bacterium]|nr:response regulator [Rhodospirillales bacterium]